MADAPARRAAPKRPARTGASAATDARRPGKGAASGKGRPGAEARRDAEGRPGGERRPGPKGGAGGRDNGRRPAAAERAEAGPEHRSGAVSALGQRLIQALQTALDAVRPVDLVLRDYFREHASLGRRDRAVIAETVFDVLRHRRLYAYLAQSGDGPMPRRLALLSQRRARSPQGGGAGKPALAESTHEAAWLDRVCALPLEGLPPAVRLSLPDWLFETLVADRGAQATESIAQALLRPAPLDLRVNTLKTDLPGALAALSADGVQATAWAGVPDALRLAGKPALERSQAFLDGLVEVQDGGSQVLTRLLAPRRGQTLVDFCAGAGGKTLALAAQLRGSGQVFACDISASRLQRLRPRLARAGATNVQPMHIDSERDPKLRRLAARADAVLVDAPCSGTGTLRRNPDLKWRLQPEEIARLQQTQKAILEAAAALVKPGGVLVYATCSLLPAENAEVAAAFEAAHPDWQADPVQPVLARQAIQAGRVDDPQASPFLTLRPDRDDCDGFFAARWIRPKP